MSRRNGSLNHRKSLANKLAQVKGHKKHKREYGKGKSYRAACRSYNRASRRASKNQLRNYDG